MAKDRIYIETCPLIDYIKGDNEPLAEDRKRNNWYIKQFMLAAQNGDVELVTSTLTVAECKRAHSEKPATDDLKSLLRSILTSGRIFTLAQVTQAIAERARDLEWQYGINLKGADAVHVATALLTGCREFLTTDGRGPIKNASKLRPLGLQAIQPFNTSLLPPEYRQGTLIKSD